MKHFKPNKPMILIETPFSYEAERNYILSVMFCEFLGLDIHIKHSDRRDTLITSNGDGSITISEGLFEFPSEKWLTGTSLPIRPLKLWNTKEMEHDLPLVTSYLPIIYGKPVEEGKWFKQFGKNIRLGVDIFGSAFFMLTRYEEIINPDKDEHNRFPAKSSLAYKEEFLYRPIVNEYLEILWACMRRIWPHLKRKKQEFKITISHDVDLPYAYLFNNVFKLLKNCSGDIFYRKNIVNAIRRISNWIKVKSSNPEADPCYTFEFMMDIAEKKGLACTFYFLTDQRNKLDGNYSILDPNIRKLLRLIHEKGHFIGLHGSYDSYQNYEQTKKEFETLIKVCSLEGIKQNRWGARQHYLRWHTPITFRNLCEAGLDYDSTLSYADHAGFRCGTCYEYPVFDLIQKKALRLKEIPLIVMDNTITDHQYMNLGRGQLALETIEKLKNICKIFNGNFTLLWHNSRLIDPLDVALYKSVLGD